MKGKLVLNFAKKKLQPLLFLFEGQHPPIRNILGVWFSSQPKRKHILGFFSAGVQLKRKYILGLCSTPTQILCPQKKITPNGQHYCTFKSSWIIIRITKKLNVQTKHFIHGGNCIILKRIYLCIDTIYLSDSMKWGKFRVFQIFKIKISKLLCCFLLNKTQLFPLVSI